MASRTAVGGLFEGRVRPNCRFWTLDQRWGGRRGEEWRIENGRLLTGFIGNCFFFKHVTMTTEQIKTSTTLSAGKNRTFHHPLWQSCCAQEKHVVVYLASIKHFQVLCHQLTICIYFSPKKSSVLFYKTCEYPFLSHGDLTNHYWEFGESLAPGMLQLQL